MSMYVEYLIKFHKKDLSDILEEEDTSKHHSININFVVLFESHQDLGLKLLQEPEKCLEEWDIAALRAQLTVLREVDSTCNPKSNVHCRIYQLAACSQKYGRSFPGNKDVGKFIQLSGTVMRITATKLLEYQRCYICVKCKSPTIVNADYDRKYMIKKPTKCSQEGCSGSNLMHFGELSSDSCKDYQEIKLQENIKDQGVAATHNTILVTLEDDLVDSCKPGDNVTICGIIKRRWGEFTVGRKIDIDISLKANYLQVDNMSFKAVCTPETVQIFNSFWENYTDNPLLARDTILKSFCPQLYGLYLVKLAIAVILAGGSQLEDTTSTGVRIRSEPHLLLVGDPGTGKSQLLQFASKIVPRSVLTTGVGSTAAGLTCTAVMERGEWHLEAGALVMSDGGICCIDEFNSMKEHDRTSIHEAMEQQTISVAKASLVCKLNTRCSILAACNPKGNVDPSEPICMSIALPSPLLSRFDLVLILRDTVNVEWDSAVADHILNEETSFSRFSKDRMWTTDTLQSYFIMIKKFHPKLTEDAELILSTYYQMQRRIDSRNKARTTVRLLESLIRLSQGHARLMCHEKVEVVDSIYAIILVDTAMDRNASILNLDVNKNSIFPESTSNDYRKMLDSILSKLQLRDILEKELAKFSQNKNGDVQSRFFRVPTNEVIIGSEENDKRSDLVQKSDELDVTENRHKSICVTDEKNVGTTDSAQNNTNMDNLNENIIAPQHSDTVKGQTKVQTSRKSIQNILCPNSSHNASKLTNRNLAESKDNKKTKNIKEVQEGQSNIVSRETGSHNFGKSKENTLLCGKKGAVEDTNGSTEFKGSQNFLDFLDLVPGVNDDFNIDLDYDWDKFKPNDALSSTTISFENSQAKQKTISTLSQRSETKSVFETEEDIENMDLDI